ncbi:MAG TPA: hypothetical protein VEM41_13010 [Actinomycetota bacterium]|nr:hypothetical protein [Actinomycetota bacterium]
MVNVRRLAAADMWGTKGSPRRRKVIRVEFWAGAIGCVLLGGITLATASGWGLVLGAWLVGVGINYVPLAISAESLSRPGALERELEGTDLMRELRRAGVQQLWIAVPLAVALAALVSRQ